MIASLIGEAQSVIRPQMPTLKSGTDLVALNVTALDPAGRAATGLGREDFTVFESDAEQPIALFSTVAEPVTWGLVLDRSGSMADMIGDLHQAALHAIAEGTAEDESFIVVFDQIPQLIREFESDRHRLATALLGLRAGGATALWDATAYALDHIRHGRHQRKVLVILTDGEDNRSGFAFREVIDFAEREEVLIYAVGMVEARGLLNRLRARPPWHRDLETLSSVTGARAHFPRNLEECRNAMKEIAREVAQQYTIGYYPRDLARDGQWRPLKVAVKPQPGRPAITARTRLGYYAPRPPE
ncbi:MAG: VWA domain-containing protein [Cyanobacteria bacterium]|nr:VWA domain-containing protein [Cyanobacteriota bacterium]